jgi:hypothetical protein
MSILLALVEDAYQNGYVVGDKVVTPIGVGEIIEVIPATAESRGDIKYVVKLSPAAVKKYNLDRDTYQFTSYDFKQRLSRSGMLEARDSFNMTSPDDQRLDYGARNMDPVNGGNFSRVDPHATPAYSYHDEHRSGRSGFPEPGAPLEELTPEEIEDERQKLQAQEQRIQIALNRLNQLAASSKKRV